jgi:Peptidase family M23
LHNLALVLKRAPLGLLSALTLLAAASAGASSGPTGASGGATAQAYGIRVVVPGQAGAATPMVSAPPDAVQFSGGFTYSPNGTVLVTTGSANASVSAVSGTEATATASAEVSNVSIFNGEITAADVTAQAHADAQPAAATGDINGSTVTNLVALGQPVASGSTATLADWGTLHTIESGTSGSAATGYHRFVTAVDVHLTADHGGLPAGTSILIGYASVAAQAAPPPPPTSAPGTNPNPKGKSPNLGPAPNPVGGLPPTSAPLTVTPALHTPGGNVFPVYGPSSYTDTYGAFRGDVSGGWHHGDDIFAPLGAPVLAVASGTVFSVGWNEVGGNRLWLRDGAGNEYYYAHLSAYTPLARNGAIVNAGDVLGFVGNTGDAQGTPYHLHFEIHPVGLLGMGYDGAVDPTTYLNRWQHLQNVSFAGGLAWAAAASSAQVPKSGAVLISATDISSANGLDPGSLQRTLAPPRSQEGAAVPASSQVPKHAPASGHPAAAAP